MNSDIRRCKTCTLPESFPDISFDADGVCSVCHDIADKKPPVPMQERFRPQLDKIIEESRATSPMYDALVAYSGGKDSTYLTYLLKKKLNLRLLAFTFDNGFISEQSFSNMRKVLQKLSVDHIVFKPSYGLSKKVFTTSANEDIYPISLLKFGSAICISCIRMVTNLSLKTAIEKKIPMIMLGNSPGQQLQSDNEIMYQDNRIPYGLKKGLFKPLAERVGEEVYPYLLLSKDDYKTTPFPYTISPLPILGYDEKEIYREIAELGWKRPTDVDKTSTNCRLNSLGITKHIRRHKFHPYDFEMAMLVRLGKISREEALDRLRSSEESSAMIEDELTKKLQ